MSLLLHLSDTHFGTEQPPVAEALLQLAERERPDIAVLSGDITQRARHSEFLAAKTFIDRLPVPVKLTLPGNHDIPLFDLWTRLFKPYRHYQSLISAELEPVYESADWLLIGVNTTRRSRHVDGVVSARQIEQVSDRLRRGSASQLKLVVTHQPVQVQRDRDAHNLLHGRQAAIKAWSQAGADVILGGHIHLPFVQPLQALHGLPREVWAVQAGTALSSRVRAEAPNSVNLIRRTAASGCVVERWDYDSSSGQFLRGTCTDIALDRMAAA